MKTIKNSILAIAAAALVMPVFNGCKKGEGDPMISLKSRKARVAGEWTVATYEENSTTTFTPTSGSASTTTDVTKIDGSAITVSKTDASGTTTSTGTVKTASQTFNKDGTWTSSMEITFTESGTGWTATSTVKIDEEGTWTFLSGVGEAKNKEYISSSTTKSVETTATTTTVTGSSTSETDTDVKTNTYGPNEKVEIWKLTTLKGKEMVAEITIDNSYTSSSNGVSGGISAKKGSKKMSLTAK